MNGPYANHFGEILGVLHNNHALRAEVLACISVQPMPGRALEGHGREVAFRAVLTALIELGQTPQDLSGAYQATERDLPRATSPHAGNNRVFPAGWAERLVRTQLSVSYNQAVLERVLRAGGTHVFVPHSPDEATTTQCSRLLAGQAHDADHLHELLVQDHRAGAWSNAPKIPDHPHCTHVVRPVDQGDPAGGLA